MANNLRDELKRMKADMQRLQKQLPTDIGNVMRNRTLENFRTESFNGEAWQARKQNEGKQRNLLVQSGKLRRSLRITRAKWGYVAIGSNVPYAQIHNEGGVTHPTVTPRMRRFAMAMYSKKRGRATKLEDSVRDSDIRKYRSEMNSANFWLNLARTKKSSLTVRIPKRQYMGAEPELENRIKKAIEACFNSIFHDGIKITVRIN